MAIENAKTLNTRIILKNDSLDNWNGSSLILQKGEIALAEISSADNYGTPTYLIKVGDGSSTFANLKWVAANAADVYKWAKSKEIKTSGTGNAVTGVSVVNNEDGTTSVVLNKEVTFALASDLGNYTTTEGLNDILDDYVTEVVLAETLKDYAAKSHSHEMIDITDLQDALDVKADMGSPTASTAGDNTVFGQILKVEAEIDTKVDKVDGKGLSTNDLTNELKAQYDAAYTHSQVAHAPADAQANIIESVKVNGAAQTITDKAVDITVPTKVSELTNDSAYLVAADIANKADKATTLAGYGIGDAYTKDEVNGEIEGAINTFVSAYITSDGGAIDKLQEIANWIDSDKNGTADIIADIEANADGIKNLGDRMDTAEDAIEAIDNHSHTNKDVIDGITAEKVSAWDGAEAAAKSHADGLNTAMNTRVEALEAIDHEHTNKALLDTYAQTEADLADAVAKKHSHSFADEAALNGITSAKVTAWDAAEQNAKDYADGLADNYAAAEHDHVIDDVTGLQDALDAKANDADLAAIAKTGSTDDLVQGTMVLVFDCGTSAV